MPTSSLSRRGSSFASLVISTSSACTSSQWANRSSWKVLCSCVLILLSNLLACTWQAKLSRSLCTGKTIVRHLRPPSYHHQHPGELRRYRWCIASPEPQDASKQNTSRTLQPPEIPLTRSIALKKPFCSSKPASSPKGALESLHESKEFTSRNLVHHYLQWLCIGSCRLTKRLVHTHFFKDSVANVTSSVPPSSLSLILSSGLRPLSTRRPQRVAAPRTQGLSPLTIPLASLHQGLTPLFFIEIEISALIGMSSLSTRTFRKTLT